VLTRVATEIRRLTSLPMGINVLRNDAETALSIALAVDAQFVRTNVHTGIAVSEQGLLIGKAHSVLRHRTFLHSDCRIYADIAVKHAQPLVHSTVEQLVRDTALRGLADGLIVSGEATGLAVDEDFVRSVYKVTSGLDVPLFVGSGVNADNVASLLQNADGVIVGTWLKKDGVTTNPVDYDRVRLFVERARKLKDS